MTTEPISSAARYVTLRDYLRVLRRYWVMIALIAIIGAAAGLANALRQKPVYQATSQVSFQDPTQQLTIVGLGAPTPQPPGQLAEVNATTATSPAVMAQVQRQLRTSIPASSLASAVSPQVAVPSGLLQITTRASTASFAAQLANAVSSVLVDQSNRQTRSQFAQVASQIRRRIAHLPRSAAAAGGALSFYEGELARLEVVGAFVRSASIAKFAQVPGGPSSPKTTRDTALGLVLGLLLGIIAAFVRDSMDRRLRNTKDIETSFELPLLGHVRNQAMGKVIYLSNGSGADHRLDLEGFRILRRNLEFLDDENLPRLILVTSAVSEEGKTTVASSVAFAMAAAGKNTLLVDADLRRPSVSDRLRIERSPGLSEYLAGSASEQEIFRTVEFAEPSSTVSAAVGSSNGHSAASMHKLTCVPSGAPTSGGAELLGSSRFRQFTADIRSRYDVVIFDSSPLLPVADTLEMLLLVDAVVLCARESRTTRDQASAAKHALRRIPARPAGVVVTGLRPQSSEYDVYTYSYDYS